MTHSLTATTQVDLHPVTGVVGLHALLLGRDGPRVTATWAGLERLRDELTRYLEADHGRMSSLPWTPEDDAAEAER